MIRHIVMAGQGTQFFVNLDWTIYCISIGYWYIYADQEQTYDI